MKNLLSYQTSEYDCGSTCLINAFRYLYNREELIPEILKFIYSISLDSYNEDGHIGKHGTSKESMQYLSYWLNHYGHTHNFKVSAREYSDDQIEIAYDNGFGQFLRDGGVIILRLWLETGHYVLLTGIDKENVYMFDPYYEQVGTKEYKFLEDLDGIVMVEDHPKEYNRIISLKRINSLTNDYYHQGPVRKRQAVAICNPSICSMDSLPPTLIDFIRKDMTHM